jgi:hypothetical protein
VPNNSSVVQLSTFSVTNQKFVCNVGVQGWGGHLPAKPGGEGDLLDHYMWGGVATEPVHVRYPAKPLHVGRGGHYTWGTESRHTLDC